MPTERERPVLSADRRPAGSPVVVDPARLADIRSLYEAGRSREAFDRGAEFGPLRAWAGAEARLLAGDLALSLGAPRLGTSLHLRVWRRAKANPAAAVAGVGALWTRKGVWAAWQQLRQMSLPEGRQANAAVQKLWLLRAQVAAAFRDFETADDLWRRAEKIAPDTPALHLTRAMMLEQEDRFADALAAARRALTLGGRPAPAVSRTAHLLQLLDQDEESLALLQTASDQTQDVPLLMCLASLQSAMDRHVDCLATLKRIRELSPILENGFLKQLSAWQARVEWRCGNAEQAIAVARACGDPASLEFAERVAAAGQSRPRVQLSVPFVAQHQDTCVPATLAALSRYWNRPVAHVAVAEAICYGGTSSLHERRWAADNDWCLREFTVTWDAARTLLDRGVPFQVLTADATSGHAQAVCGYDTTLRTLILRDPNFRHVREVPADEFLKAHRSTGPAGLALVPSGKAGLIAALDLPDAALRERIQGFEEALDRHDRESAAGQVSGLENDAPGHWLTLQARLRLAFYDANVPQMRECLDGLLKRFEDDPRLLLQKLDTLLEHEYRDERLALLDQVCCRPGCDPVFYVRYARELGEDAREAAGAHFWVRRALYRGEVKSGLSCLADLLWSGQRFPEAFELYRFCACLAETEEGPVQRYFAAARHLNLGAPALQFLRARFERLGGKSPQPALSLCRALEQVGQDGEAQAALHAAQQRMPENAALQLFAAQAALRAGQTDQAGEALKLLEKRISDRSWRLLKCQVAEQRGDREDALALWRDILQQDPLFLPAHEALARLLAQTAGRPAALAHLEQTCQRFPRHFGLHQLWFDWQQEEDSLSTEPIVRHLLELNPKDAHAHRLLARVLHARGKLKEAMAETDVALQLDPTHPHAFALRGYILQRQGRTVDAQQAFRKAIALAVDYGEYMAGLMSCCKTIWDRRLALESIRGELEKKLVYGDGILAFRELAQSHLNGSELLKMLGQIQSGRPDLWHSWAALIRELTAQGDFKEAARLAQAAVERFPSSTPLLEETAAMHQAKGDAEAELATRQKIVDLNPGDPAALCRLAHARLRAGDLEKARALLDDAVRRHPAVGYVHCQRARLLWQQDQREAAVEQIKQALNLNPGDDLAWDALGLWSKVLKQPELPRATLQELARRRPADPEPWLRLAHLHLDTDQAGDALAAVDKALALHPRSLTAQDLRILILSDLGRHEEALAASRSEAWGAQRPPQLRAREATLIHARGDHTGAVAIMRAVLDETPRLLWGWRTLAGWLYATEKKTEADAAVQRLLQLGSQDPAAQFWVAEMKMNSGDVPEAVERLERALELNPAYLPARIQLMFIQVRTNQFQAVQDTLNLLRLYGAEDWAMVGEAQLDLNLGDITSAFRRLYSVCRTPGADEGAIRSMVKAVRTYGARTPLEKALRQLLSEPAPGRVLGPLWVQACLDLGRLPDVKQLLCLCCEPASRRRAIEVYLNADLPRKAFPWGLLQRRKLRRELRRLARAEGEWLRSDVTAWSCYGMALSEAKAYGAAWRWWSQWRERPTLAPWALSNIMNVCVITQRLREAEDIAAAALAKPPDHSTCQVALRLAWLEVNAGKAEPAAKHLAAVQEDQLPRGWGLFLEMVRGIVQVGQCSPPERKQEARRVWQQWRNTPALRLVHAWDPFFRRLFLGSADFLAASGAGWHARLGGRVRAWRRPWPRRR